MQTNLLSRKSLSSAPVAPSSKPPRKRRRWLPIVLVLLGLLGLAVFIFGTKGAQIFSMISAGKAMKMPPTTVTSTVVQEGVWERTITAVGTVAPVQGATISAEIPGMVSEVAFQSGTPVKKGDMLVKLETSGEEAQLRSAQADAELAKADLDRARDLAARRVISKSEFEAAAAKFEQRDASVQNMQAVIDKKQIRAPFDGIAGIREVNVGQMVSAGDRLVTLQALDQVYVNFSLPQQQIGDVAVGLPVKITSDAVPGGEFEGQLTAINSAIDSATRSLGVQATLDNPDHSLRAGMFARVRVVLPQKNPTLFIPATSISYAPFGNSVYVIEKQQDEETKEEKLVLRQQFIRIGETRGDFVAVTEGLKAGDQIVSSGVFKLRNKMDVVIDNTLAPKPEENPQPANT